MLVYWHARGGRRVFSRVFPLFPISGANALLAADGVFGNHSVSEEVQRIAWRAQERLCARFRKLTACGKNKNKMVTAVARELAGFIWAIGHEPKLLAS